MLLAASAKRMQQQSARQRRPGQSLRPAAWKRLHELRTRLPGNSERRPRTKRWTLMGHSVDDVFGVPGRLFRCIPLTFPARMRSKCLARRACSCYRSDRRYRGQQLSRLRVFVDEVDLPNVGAFIRTLLYQRRLGIVVSVSPNPFVSSIRFISKSLPRNLRRFVEWFKIVAKVYHPGWGIPAP